MGATQANLLLPVSLLALLSVATADLEAPKAIKKLLPDSGEKLLARDLEFTLPFISSYEALLFARDAEEGGSLGLEAPYYRRAYAPHYYDDNSNILRRAAEALAMLEGRSACPAGMSSCAEIGNPNKCCQQGTYCTSVDDSMVGGVACCPQGSSCGGGVGDCPSDAVSCPASLGGGCCIAGYVCQGAGCVPSASATPSRTTATEVETTTEDAPTDTITTTRTTVIEGEPSTVVVTMTITRGATAEPTTTTATEIVTVSESESESELESSSESSAPSRSATGGAPWRPTSGIETSSSAPEPTQTGCPTGFYGCLATHGGGCCQTGRNCEKTSCPPQSSTTIMSDGATVVVAATDVPSQASSTCAGGWFLCGEAAGPVAGCCPSGYQCGTASCFSAGASETAQVQKEFPESPDSGASNGSRGPATAVVCLFFILLSIFL